MSVFGMGKRKGTPNRAGRGVHRESEEKKARDDPDEFIKPARPDGVFSDAAWESFTYTEHTLALLDEKLHYMAYESDRIASNNEFRPKLALMFVAIVPGFHTRGVFARRAIKKGTNICEYVGLVVGSHQESEYFMDIPNGNDKFTVDASLYGNISRFLNHSETPNVESYATGAWKRHVTLRTTRDIAVGEQLSYNYGDDYKAPFKDESDCSKVAWPASQLFMPS